jgi:acyl-CoA synthetase (NDP forming)
MLYAVPHALEPLIRPRSVAIVGASADAAKTAGKPAGYLKKHGYAGRLYLVNPRYTAIDGQVCVPRIADLPEAPDVGLVLLGGQAAVGAVRELAVRGTPTAIVLAGGYAEVDAVGAERQANLVTAAQGMRLLGPNTIGVVNVPDGTALSASAALELEALLAGHVAVVSQSGGMLGALLSRGVAHGLGFSRLVSTGNEADVDVCDVLEYLLDDAATRVIALYLESVRRPARFRELAAGAVDRGKPLIVFKVGRSEAGARSATSHTGAIAGTDRLYDALFAQTGAFRVDTLDGLIDVSAALISGRVLAGPRLGILTSTGGGGALVADACGVLGFDVPPPDQPTVDRLRAALVGEGAMADRNPIDLTMANLRSDTYRDTVAALVDSPTYDAVVVVVGSSGLGDPSLAAGPVRDAAAVSAKPVVAYVNPHAMNIVDYLNRVGVPAFSTAEGCAAGLAAMRGKLALGTRYQQAPGAPGATLGRHGRQLNEAESLALFASHGIPVARHAVAPTPRAAEEFARTLGGPVVVKILSRAVAHKSDVGGVRLNVNPVDVGAVCAELRAALPGAMLADGWLVQEQIVDATEVLLGVVRDAQLGQSIALGAGGINTEVFADCAMRLLPLGPLDPAEMLGELKSRVLLEGFRGRPLGDVEALLGAVRQFAAMAEALGDGLLEAEINPLFVLPRGRGVVAADGLVVLAVP